MHKCLFIFLLLPNLLSSQSIREFKDFIIIDGDTANQYLNGLKHGLWVESSEICEISNNSRNLEKQSIRNLRWYWKKGNYNLGVKNGFWTKYFFNRIVLETKFDSNGQKEYTSYYYVDQISSIKTYSKGKPFLFVSMHTNGQVNFRAKYVENEFGDFRAFYLDGTLKFEGSGNGLNDIENLKFYTEKGIPRAYRSMTMIDILNRIGLTHIANCYFFDLIE